jgi:hypothetical protein
MYVYIHIYIYIHIVCTSVCIYTIDGLQSLHKLVTKLNEIVFPGQQLHAIFSRAIFAIMKSILLDYLQVFFVNCQLRFHCHKDLELLQQHAYCTSVIK